MSAALQRPASPTSADPIIQRDLLDDVTDVAGGLKKQVLGSVAEQAKSIPGYGLLTTVVGKDPITDAPVERNGAALINGFLDIIPGSEKIRQPLAESHAVEKAGAWFDQEVPKLGLTFAYLNSLVMKALDSLGVADLGNIGGAIARVVGIFNEPIQRLKTFATGAARTLMSFIVEGAMALAGDAGALVMGIVRRAGAAFDRIVADPMGFLANLVAAAKGGFLAFASNIGTHLKNGLISWLTGSLGGVIRIPAKFDLPGILGMAMDFLGITWAKVRSKIVKFIPAPVLDKLEAVAGLIGDIKQRGLAAVTDKIAEFADGLIGMVMGGIKDWVVNNVVTKAIMKVVTFFNPAGAIVQAAMAIYDTVMFFVERGKQIAAMAEAMFDSIEAIASGAIDGAVAKVENALGRAVPVLLGFLARLIGLGDIATPVKNVMTEVQTFVDGALDKAIGWVAGVAKKLAGKLGFGKKDKEASADLQPALGDAQNLLSAKGTTADTVKAGLPALRDKHSLKKAELHPANGAPGNHQIHLQRAEADTPPVPLVDGGDTAKAEKWIGKAVLIRSGTSGRDIVATVESIDEKQGVVYCVFKNPVQQGTSAESRKPVPIAKFVASIEVSHDPVKPYDGGDHESALVVADKSSSTGYVLDPQKVPFGKVRSKFYKGSYAADTAAKLSSSLQNGGIAHPDDVKANLPLNERRYWARSERGESREERAAASRGWVDPKLDPSRLRATADHDPSVSEHWNDLGGNNTDQASRSTWYIAGPFEMVPKSVNSSEANQEESYKREVGPGFLGPGEKRRS